MIAWICFIILAYLVAMFVAAVAAWLYWRSQGEKPRFWVLVRYALRGGIGR